MALPVMISLVANPLNATSLMLGIVLWSGYLVWLWNIFKTMIKGKEKRVDNLSPEAQLRVIEYMIQQEEQKLPSCEMTSGDSVFITGFIIISAAILLWGLVKRVFHGT